MKQSIVHPAAAPQASYAEQARAAGSLCIGEANKFISHAYDCIFLDIVDAIAAWEARQTTGGPFFYYLDLLVFNQQASLPFEVLRDEIGGSVRAIGHTLLVLKWDNPVPLTRAWCIFEVGVTLAANAKLEVIMPPLDAAAFKSALVKDFDSLAFKLCTVDVASAKAKEPSDLESIQRAIKESGGYLRTNQLVTGAMKAWMVGEARAELDAMPVDRRAAASALIGSLVHHLIDQGQLGEAEPLCREALEGRRRTQGEDHPDTLHSLNDLANLLKNRGRLGEAEALHREALEGRRRALGSDHSETLHSVSNVAILLCEQGKLGKAEPLCREAMEGFRRILGDAHPETLDSISNLAVLLEEQGKLEEAEPLFREALEGRRRTLGEGHPDTLTSMTNTAGLLTKRGKREEAKEMYRQELSVSHRALGEDHPRTQLALHNASLHAAAAAAAAAPAPAAPRRPSPGAPPTASCGCFWFLDRPQTPSTRQLLSSSEPSPPPTFSPSAAAAAAAAAAPPPGASALVANPLHGGTQGQAGGERLAAARTAEPPPAAALEGGLEGVVVGVDTAAAAAAASSVVEPSAAPSAAAPLNPLESSSVSSVVLGEKEVVVLPAAAVEKESPALRGEEEEPPLPPGWVRCGPNEKGVCWYDHPASCFTQWERPTPAQQPPSAAAPALKVVLPAAVVKRDVSRGEEEPPLPPGWVKCGPNEVGAFWYDHPASCYTQWERPTPAQQPPSAAAPALKTVTDDALQPGGEGLLATSGAAAREKFRERELFSSESPPFPPLFLASFFFSRCRLPHSPMGYYFHPPTL